MTPGTLQFVHAMLPGFRGHHVAEALLARHAATAAPAAHDSAVMHRALVHTRRQAEMLGPASPPRMVFERALAPFLTALGFTGSTDIRLEENRLWGTLVSARFAALTVVGVPWGTRLDRPLLAPGPDVRRVALFNGSHLRLMAPGPARARGFVEFDLDIAADDRHTFDALVSLLHADRWVPDGNGAIDLDRLMVASGRYQSDVCRALRLGVLTASAEILATLVARTPVPAADDAFEHALTIVYRLLFLLFAEARGLVPMWHPVYRRGYSIASLQAAAERPGPAPGLWDALRAATRLAHAGCRADDLRVTAFNGRLFAPRHTPLAKRRGLDDERVRRALLALTSKASTSGRERICYEEIGLEQFGAVYETLLDYQPHVGGDVDSSPDAAARTRPRSTVEPPAVIVRSEVEGRRGRRQRGIVVSLRRGSGVRKATGTFYTPEPIARYLARQTLSPLTRDATPDAILRLKVLDPAMGSGAFLVAACAFLAEQYEDALIQSGACAASDLGPQEQALIRRRVAELCLFGVDVNPMAVQLARLSLWLATLAADRPLSFLDHHLQSGDSLLGTWLFLLRRAPSATRRHAIPLPLLDLLDAAETIKSALPVRFALSAMPNDTIEQVREKERALTALSDRDTPLSRWKRVADLWCARWFSDAAGSSPFHDVADAILTGRSALPAAAAARYMRDAETCAAMQRFFHWELEFPEAFFDGQGERLESPGFDALLGNPPWDMIRADDRRQGGPEVRVTADAVIRFTRDSGVYAAQSSGHANRYHLFVERATALVRPGGRLGLVLPAGFASDAGAARLRRLLLSRCGVDRLVGFDNTARIFPIHRSVRFLLTTATCGEPTTAFHCQLGETDPAVLDLDLAPAAAQHHLGAAAPIRVTPALLQRLSGDDLALPDIRSPLDLAILERTSTCHPALGDRTGWHVRFGRELNASDDRPWFTKAGHGLPVVEGKHIDPFRVHASRSASAIAAADAARLLGSRHTRPRLAYRDVASATNRQTLIAAILPANCVSTHTLFCLRTPLPLAAQHYLCALFNSFVLNYLVRLRVSTHVTTAIVERLPVPPADASPAFHEIAAMGRLLRESQDERVRTRLNGRVGRLYRLTLDEFAHVLNTFPLVPRDERDAALRAFAERDPD